MSKPGSVGILKTVLVAAIASAAAMIGFLPVSPGAPSRAEIEANFLQNLPFAASLREQMPDVFEELIDEVEAGIARSEGEPLEVTVSQAIVTIRMRYGVHAVRAPDAAMKEMLLLHRALMERLLSAYGPEDCAPFAVQGGAAVPDLMAQEAKLASAAVSRFWDVVAAGRENPTVWADPTEDDWSDVAEAMMTDGIPPEEFSVLRDPNPQDPANCRIALAMFDAVIALEGPNGPKVRSALIKDLVSTPFPPG